MFVESLSKNMEMHHEDPERKWYFTEVLDNLMTLYIIKSQVRVEMEKQGFRVDSSDEEEHKKHEVMDSLIKSHIGQLEAGLVHRDS